MFPPYLWTSNAYLRHFQILSRIPMVGHMLLHELSDKTTNCADSHDKEITKNTFNCSLPNRKL